MLVYQKTMFDPYYCIKSIRHLKTWKNASKSSFCITIMAHKTMNGSKVLKTPVPKKQLTSF